MNKHNLALAIHGGAGTILRSEMTAELETEYLTALEEALSAGWKVLNGGGIALDAVETAVVNLENFPLFNAGRGAVFTHEGKNEMDAAIMDGKNLRAGTISNARISLQHLRNVRGLRASRGTIRIRLQAGSWRAQRNVAAPWVAVSSHSSTRPVSGC